MLNSAYNQENARICQSPFLRPSSDANDRFRALHPKHEYHAFVDRPPWKWVSPFMLIFFIPKMVRFKSTKPKKNSWPKHLFGPSSYPRTFQHCFSILLRLEVLVVRSGRVKTHWKDKKQGYNFHVFSFCKLSLEVSQTSHSLQQFNSGKFSSTIP